MTTAVNAANLILYQHNDLVRAPLRLSNKTEARLFTFALSCLHQKHDSLEIELRIVDIAETHGGNSYDLVRNAAAGLSGKTVKTENTDPRSPRFFQAIPIFTTIKVDEETGLITGQFNEKLKPFLLDLKGHFTKVEMITLLMLKSVHANRLYWLLKSYRSLAKGMENEKYPYNYQKLRDDMLGINSESYLLWNDFNRFILKPAFKEINATGWLVKAEKADVGKKVDEVIFTIPAIPGEEEEKKPKALREKNDKPALNPASNLETRVIIRLQKLSVTEAQIRQVLNILGGEEVKLTKLMKVTHPLLKECEASHKADKNYGATAMDLLKTTFPELYRKAD